MTDVLIDKGYKSFVIVNADFVCKNKIVTYTVRERTIIRASKKIRKLIINKITCFEIEI